MLINYLENIIKTKLSVTTSCFQRIDMSYNILYKSFKSLKCAS